MSSIVHRGQIVEKAVKNSGIKISELSRKLDKSRRFVYVLFSNEVAPLHYVRKIGTIINYNFSKEIPELEEDLGLSENDMSWKDKYISLLEEHNQFLKKMLAK